MDNLDIDAQMYQLLIALEISKKTPIIMNM